MYRKQIAALVVILIASTLIGIIATLNQMSYADTHMTVDGHAYVMTTDHIAIDVTDNAAPNNETPMVSEDRYSRYTIQVSSWIDTLIPAMLPHASGQCGEDSGVSCN